MVFTERQKTELKNISKEITKEILSEFMTDNDFLETIAKKVADKVNKQLKNLSDKVVEMEAKIINIQGENEELYRKVDDLEQKLKLDQLRFYGVPESKNENLKSKIEEIFASKLAINKPNIQQCYRIGKQQQTTNSKPRSVIIKFTNVHCRNDVFSRKKNLKGTNMVLGEDLVRSRFGLLTLAKEKLGPKKVWSHEGNILTMAQGRKYWLKSEEDVLKLCK